MRKLLTDQDFQGQSNPVMWNDFSLNGNAVPAFLGSGQAVTITGAQAFTVANGELRTTANGSSMSTSYLYGDQSETVRRVQAKIKFGAGLSGAVVALITGPVNASMLGGVGYTHIIFSRTSCAIQNYVSGTITNIGGPYVYSTPMKDDGTTYIIGYEIVGTTVTVFLPNSETFSATDAGFANYTGGRVIWEVTSWVATGGSANAEPKFLEIAAYSKNTNLPISPYTTPLEVQKSLMSYTPAIKVARFTPTTTGTYRIASFANQMTGICCVQTVNNSFFDSSIPACIFSYTGNIYQAGQLLSLANSGVNTPAVTKARTSGISGTAYLDLDITVVTTPQMLEIWLFGPGCGSLLELPLPVTYNYVTPAGQNPIEITFPSY